MVDWDHEKETWIKLSSKIYGKVHIQLDSYRSHFTRLPSLYMTITTIICYSTVHPQDEEGKKRKEKGEKKSLYIFQTTRQTAVPKSFPFHC